MDCNAFSVLKNPKFKEGPWVCKIQKRDKVQCLRNIIQEIKRKLILIMFWQNPTQLIFQKFSVWVVDQLEYNFPKNKTFFFLCRYMPKQVHHRSFTPHNWKSMWHTVKKKKFTHSHIGPTLVFNLVLTSKVFHVPEMSHPLLSATYLLLFNSLSPNENFYLSRWSSLPHLPILLLMNNRQLFPFFCYCKWYCYIYITACVF